MQLSCFQKQIRDAGSDIMLHQNDTYVGALSQVAFLKNNHLRTAFYKEHCGMVPPREIVLGHRMLYVKGRMRQRRDLAYCVHVKDLLLALVSMPEVRYHIDNPHCTRDGYMGDFCDGTSYEIYPLLRHNKKALQFLLYLDDIEVVNPLGTGVRKHKVTMIYISLLNIPPADRSKLSAIYVYAIAKSKDLKRHGLAKVMQDFVDRMNQMSSEGITLEVNRTEQRFYGCLVAVVRDTPAANMIGGFKEGVGFAHKPCRTCHVADTELSQYTNSRECQLREFYDHKEKCNLLFEQPLTKKAQQEWSKR